MGSTKQAGPLSIILCKHIYRPREEEKSLEYYEELFWDGSEQHNKYPATML